MYRRKTLYWSFAVVGVVLVLISALILHVRGVFAPTLPAARAEGAPIQMGKTEHRVAGRIYLEGTARPGAPLVVVLHGDAPGRKPSYQYFFASSLAEELPGTRVVALLRPGYADPFGGRSDGDRGSFAAGENYTPEVIANLAAAIGEMKARWGAQRVVLVGHSGGATLAADIAALHTGLVQKAILVSCPCDVPAFRLHMARSQFSPFWLLPVHALSPLATLSEMSRSTSILAISGDEDQIALPQYSKGYVSAARTRGLSASMIVIAGQGHEILLLPQVLQIAIREIKTPQI